MTTVPAVQCRRRFFTWLGVICAGGFIGRVWFAAAVVDPRNPKSGLSDEVFYHLQARLVADGRGFLNPFLHFAEDAAQRFDQPTALHPPLYTLFLSVPAKLGLTSMLTQRICTALLGTATIFLLAVLGRRLVGDRVGLCAAVLAAASPALWLNDTVIGLETLYCFLVVAALLTLYDFWQRPRMSRALLLAVWLALAALTRSEGVILLVFLAVPTVLLVTGLEWRRRIKILAAMAGVVVVIMAPWVIRNLTTFEEPTTLGTGFGVVLAYGNCDATYSGPHLGYWDDRCALRGYVPGSDESVFDARARKRGLDYMQEHLTRLPIVVAARVGRVWDVFRPFQNVDLNAFFERRGSAASWAGLISYWILMPLAIGGLVVLRRRRIPIFPYLAIAASVTVTVATSFGITRYRAPVDVVLPLLAAVAIDALLRARRGRASTRAPDEPSAIDAPRAALPESLR